MWPPPVSARVTTAVASHAVVLDPLAGRDEKTAARPLPAEAFAARPPPPRRTLPAGHVAVETAVSVPSPLLLPGVAAAVPVTICTAVGPAGPVAPVAPVVPAGPAGPWAPVAPVAPVA